MSMTVPLSFKIGKDKDDGSIEGYSSELLRNTNTDNLIISKVSL